MIEQSEQRKTQEKVKKYIDAARGLGVPDGETTRDLLSVEIPIEMVKKSLTGEPFFGNVLLSIRNLSREFGLRRDFRVTALKDIDLDVREGEFLSITGHSGSGKSTLLNLIGLVDTPSSGRIMISQGAVAKDSAEEKQQNYDEKEEKEKALGGDYNYKFIPKNVWQGDLEVKKRARMVNIVNLDEKQKSVFRLRFISFIFQFFNLINNYTALENVIFPLRLQGYSHRESKERAREIINFLGLAERAKYYPAKLSGGEQQRVAVGRSIARDASLILADEPTAHLDSKNAQSIINLLRDVNVKFGKTIILVTHELEYAKQADRAVVLKDGKMLEILGS